MAKVHYEKRSRIGYITLNRPDALNALDDELNSELWTVWDDFARDDSKAKFGVFEVRYGLQMVALSGSSP